MMLSNRRKFFLFDGFRFNLKCRRSNFVQIRQIFVFLNRRDIRMSQFWRCSTWRARSRSDSPKSDSLGQHVRVSQKWTGNDWGRLRDLVIGHFIANLRMKLGPSLGDLTNLTAGFANKVKIARAAGFYDNNQLLFKIQKPILNWSLMFRELNGDEGSCFGGCWMISSWSRAATFTNWVKVRLA